MWFRLPLLAGNYRIAWLGFVPTLTEIWIHLLCRDVTRPSDLFGRIARASPAKFDHRRSSRFGELFGRIRAVLIGREARSVEYTDVLQDEGSSGVEKLLIVGSIEGAAVDAHGI